MFSTKDNQGKSTRRSVVTYCLFQNTSKFQPSKAGQYTYFCSFCYEEKWKIICIKTYFSVLLLQTEYKKHTRTKYKCVFLVIVCSSGFTFTLVLLLLYSYTCKEKQLSREQNVAEQHSIAISSKSSKAQMLVTTARKAAAIAV